MKRDDFIELKIPAKAEYVGVARLLISGVGSRLGFSIEEIEDMKVAVAEACTNVVNHAYQGEEGQILIACSAFPTHIDIMVIDHGQSFDIQKIQSELGPVDRNISLEKLNEGGLGLFLIESLMDKVEINQDSGVVILMSKYKRGDEVVSDDQSFSTTPS